MDIKRAFMVDASADTMILDGVVCGIIATAVVIVSAIYESIAATILSAIVCFTLVMAAFHVLGRKGFLVDHAQFWRRGLTILLVTGIVTAYQVV